VAWNGQHGTVDRSARPDGRTGRARRLGVGVPIGIVTMFLVVAGSARQAAPDAGPAYWLGLGAFAALVTGGFFGGAVFASRFSGEQERRMEAGPACSVAPGPAARPVSSPRSPGLRAAPARSRPV
jgi:hypothetical protein